MSLLMAWEHQTSDRCTSSRDKHRADSGIQVNLFGYCSTPLPCLVSA